VRHGYESNGFTHADIIKWTRSALVFAISRQKSNKIIGYDIGREEWCAFVENGAVPPLLVA